MSFTIVKKSKRGADAPPVVAKPPLVKMRYAGPEIPGRLPKFLDDLSYMKGELRAAGMDLPLADCQRLWVRLSIDNYPLPEVPPTPWLRLGIVAGLMDNGVSEYLAEA